MGLSRLAAWTPFGLVVTAAVLVLTHKAKCRGLAAKPDHKARGADLC